MSHISELVPQPGERAATFGGTRAGKSAFSDMSMIHVSHERPDAMQVLVDSKPRYRAETERGPFRRGRRQAAYRYSSWAKGPVVPNSVVVDIWDDHPFRGLWQNPGEIAILQSGEFEDWKRILQLLNGFVKANIKGRERRIIVDECLDFTLETPGVLIRKTMSFIAPQEQVESGILGLTWALIEFTDSPLSFSTCSIGSLCSIWSVMPI